MVPPSVLVPCAYMRVFQRLNQSVLLYDIIICSSKLQYGTVYCTVQYCSRKYCVSLDDGKRLYANAQWFVLNVVPLFYSDIYVL